MISKTLVATALVASLASAGAMAGPHKKSQSTAAERNATQQLNAQQLASGGSYTTQPVPPAAMAAPANPAAAPTEAVPTPMPAPAGEAAPPAQPTPPVTAPPQ
jgi:dethiobiotin synthetase